MERILNYILGGVIIVLLTLLGVQWFKGVSKDKQILALNSELNACQNAPVHVDTVHDTIRIVTKQWLHPKPTTGGNIHVDTDIPCDSIESSYYSETFKENGVQIHYEALTACDNKKAILESIRFPEIIVPTEKIIETKTVTDTVTKEVPAKINNSFLVYGEVVGNSLEVFPGVGVGVGFQFKNNWSITFGGNYMFPTKTTYANVRFTFNFHK